MMEPWLAGFLIGFFGIMAAVLILHKAWEWGYPELFLLFLAGCYVFDFYPHIPSDLSPFQSTAGRMGCFLGAASSCIWLDAPEGEKTHALLCIGNWVQFTMTTAVFSILASIYLTLISSDTSYTSLCITIIIWILIAPVCILITKDKIGFLYFIPEKKGDDYSCLLGLIACITAIWLWWNGDPGEYAAAIYDLDTIDRTLVMIIMLLGLSLIYDQSDSTEKN